MQISKRHSDAYDEGYRRGYDDGWFRGERFSYNSVAAASSSTTAGSGDDGSHKHKDSAAASSMLLMMFMSVFLCLNLWISSISSYVLYCCGRPVSLRLDVKKCLGREK